MYALFSKKYSSNIFKRFSWKQIKLKTANVIYEALFSKSKFPLS